MPSAQWRWVGAMALSSILLCVAITAVHLLQRQRLSQTTTVLLELKQASVDLDEAFLHLQLSGDANSPWQRPQGLALLTQAAESLQEVGDATGEVAQAREIVQAINLLRSSWATTDTRDRKVELQHRLALHELHNRLAALDAAVARQGRIAGQRMDTVFNTVILLAALLLGGVCVGMVRSQRARERAQAELARSEAWLRSTFSALTEGVLVFNAEPRVIDGNPAAERLLGMTLEHLKALPPGLRHWSSRRVDGTPLRAEDLPLAVALGTGIPQVGQVLGVEVPGRGLRLLSVNAEPLTSAVQGHVTGAVVSFSDVTEALALEGQLAAHRERLEELVQARTAELTQALQAQREAERELGRVNEILVQRAQQAESATRAKSAFLANMSHEIRTPLHGMLGMAQRLQQAPLPDEQLQQVQVIERSGQLLLGVIDDVLDFSRIESGRLELEREPFDLVQLARDAVALFEPRAQAKSLDLQLALEPGVTQAWLLGDSLRLSQILNNLLSNAVKFTATGGVVLQLSALGEGHWRVAVRDTGIGLSAADRHRIFEPFLQADSSTTRRFGGTGLGLAIVRSLVQLHGGELEVNSELGRGTELRFVLKWPPASQPSEKPPAVPGQTPGACLASRRALVAEDNEVNMTLACAILQALDMGVLQAANGVEAVQAFGDDRPDVVLMDMHMPEMDGLDATRRIRALEAARGWPRTPIVALTASALPEDRRRCIDAGMDEVLVKPFQSAQLQKVLERYC